MNLFLKIHFVCPIEVIMQKHKTGIDIIEWTPADPHDFLDRFIKSLQISGNLTFLLTWQD